MFSENQQIGLYTLVGRIGRGGFGEVWLAERRAKFVTTKVAVKLPHDEQVDHETIKQEARLWEQASGHPNILPIIDADEYDGQIVIVSEYAPDGSLDRWLKTHGKMPVEKAAEMTIKILDGLEFLHSKNIIHRDLKPANILLQGNTPRLADFGISRALRTTASSQSSNISGTFAYMPPEGFDGKRSVQTDIWSVGVNLYQFVTGNLPFPQKEPSALIAAIIMRDFEPLPPDVPHQINGCGKNLTVFYLMPETAEAQKVSEKYLNRNRGFALISRAIVADLSARMSSVLKHWQCTNSDAFDLGNHLIHSLKLSPAAGLRESLDARVRRAVEFIESKVEDKIPVNEIAKIAWSSVSRLAHVFKDETNLAIRRYQVWLKLRAAIKCMSFSKNLDYIANAAGFCDQSHINKYFLEMHGILPSALVRHSKIIDNDEA